MHLESKASGGFSLTVFQARLDVVVTSIGSMNPQVIINYSGLSVKTKTAGGMDRLPHWTETFNFELMDGDIEFIVIHRPLLLKDIEIGRCRIPVIETSGWVEIMKDGVKVGSIRVCVKDDKDITNCTSLCSRDSFDMDYSKRLNELELEKEEAVFYKNKYKAKLEKIRQVKRKSNAARVLTEETTEIEGNFEFYSENSDYLSRVQAQIAKLQKSQEEINKRKELLRLQEENISIEKQKLLQEWEEISRERNEFSIMKKRISDEYLKIRGEQEKVQNLGKLAVISRGKTNREHQRHHQILCKIQDTSPEPSWRFENTSIDRRSLVVEDLHEKAQINRVPMTVEKPRPPLHPLSANSSRLIAFE